MAFSFAHASQCDMEACGTPVNIDSGKGILCNRVNSDCDCITLQSDCWAAKRSKTCSGKDGWSINHGKMIGYNQDGNICCGYKLPEGKECPKVSDDEKTLSYSKDYKKGFFVNEIFGWRNSDCTSTYGARASFEMAYLDICISAHHTNAIQGANNEEKWQQCISECKNPNTNVSCKSKIKNSSVTICSNLCNCIYGLGTECIKN